MPLTSAIQLAVLVGFSIVCAPCDPLPSPTELSEALASMQLTTTTRLHTVAGLASSQARSSRVQLFPTLTRKPNKSEDLFQDGLRLLYQGRYEDAIAAFSTLISEHPQFTKAYIERGIAYLESDQPEISIEDFSTAITQDPTNARALYYCLRAFHSLNQTHEVEADLERLLALNAVDIETIYFRGQGIVLVNDDDHTEYDTFISLTPQTAQEYYYRAYFHQQLGNVEAQMADYGEAIARFPYFTDVYFDRAMTWRYGLGDTEAALADFARVLDIDPGDVFAHLNRADIFAKQGDRRSAEAEYEAAIALDPVVGYRSRGSYRRANDKPLGALNDYSRAIAYAPNDTALYYFRASVYQRLGNYTRAVADYETIMRIRANRAQPEAVYPS